LKRQASVVFVDENEGMGLMFRETEAVFHCCLRKWLLSAMMGKKAAANAFHFQPAPCRVVKTELPYKPLRAGFGAPTALARNEKNK